MVIILVRNGTETPRNSLHLLCSAPSCFLQYASINSLSYTIGRPSSSTAPCRSLSFTMYVLSTSGASNFLMLTAALTAAAAIAAEEARFCVAISVGVRTCILRDTAADCLAAWPGVRRRKDGRRVKEKA
eukprot:687334-Hanusia_phi.AAC.3